MACAEAVLPQLQANRSVTSCSGSLFNQHFQAVVGASNAQHVQAPQTPHIGNTFSEGPALATQISEYAIAAMMCCIFLPTFVYIFAERKPPSSILLGRALCISWANISILGPPEELEPGKF